jgi:hypothetical protein
MTPQRLFKHLGAEHWLAGVGHWLAAVHSTQRPAVQTGVFAGQGWATVLVPAALHTASALVPEQD